MALVARKVCSRQQDLLRVELHPCHLFSEFSNSARCVKAEDVAQRAERYAPERKDPLSARGG